MNDFSTDKKWDGRSKGSLLGYRFFMFCIEVVGIRIARFICFFVVIYFFIFSPLQRKALIQFYKKGFQYSTLKSFYYSFYNFYQFGTILIDRIALRTSRKKQYSHSFDNEIVLHNIINNYQQGGFLFSGHVGNWENAGNLIGERITTRIHILMLDAEVEKIKTFIEQKTDKLKYHIIPLKEDLSHLIAVYQAVKNKELVALHADRIYDSSNTKPPTFLLPFLNQQAHFPANPFIMAYKLKVPISFVFAIKTSATHFALSASEPLIGGQNIHSPQELALCYVQHLEKIVLKYPTQWFNFYNFFHT